MSHSQAISSDDPIESATGTLDLAVHAAQQGAADAREAAARTWTKAERFLCRFVYTTCYTTSYGFVFPAVLLARVIPLNNAAVRGLIDGAHAAQKKADELYPLGLETAATDPAPGLAPA